MSELPVIEHGSTRGGRWVRERRLQLAVGLALLEGVLVAVDVIQAWVAIVLALAVLAVYFGWARAQSAEWIRESAWVVAVSAGARRCSCRCSSSWSARSRSSRWPHWP